jgi:hypothetical protein
MHTTHAFGRLGHRRITMATFANAFCATIALFGTGFGVAPALADIPSREYRGDTGWVHYDGGCKARVRYAVSGW